MTAQSILKPFISFEDTRGRPLDNGYIYIGEAGKVAKSNQIQVYWDEDQTVPAAQPIRTINGYLSRSGSPGNIYVDASDYSMFVEDRRQRLVYSQLRSPIRLSATILSSELNALVKYDYLQQLVDDTQAEDAVFVASYHDTWLTQNDQKKGEAIWYKTGGTNISPSVGSPTLPATIGTNDQAGYLWDADGFEWRLTIDPDGVRPEQLGAYGDRVNYDDQAIADAISYCPSWSTVRLSSNSTYLIRDSKRVNRFKSFVGGPNCQVVADFRGSNWLGATQTIFELVTDDIAANDNIFRSHGRQFGGFNIMALHDSPVTGAPVGVRVFTTLAIPKENANIYSYYGSEIYEITVDQCDTGFQIEEMTNGSIRRLQSLNTRRGLSFAGRSLNVDVQSCKFANISRDFTIDTGLMVGIQVTGKTYTNGFARPEGITLRDTTTFDAETGLWVDDVYVFNAKDCIIDGNKQDAVRIGLGTAITISDCFIKAEGAFKGIRIDASTQQDDRKFTIRNNEIINDNAISGSDGIFLTPGGDARRGVKIIGNKFDFLDFAIRCQEGFQDSVINDNHGHNIQTRFAQFDNNMAGCIFDGNTCDDNVPILFINTNVSSNFAIGRNYSGNSQTYFTGSATLLDGQSTVDLPNNFYSPGDEFFYRAITIIQPLDDFGAGTRWHIEQDVSGPTSRLTLNTNASGDKAIRYIAHAAPFSAFNQN